MNNRIVIDLSKGELNFVREALETKHINMMSYLDTCEKQSAEDEMWNLVQGIAEDDVKKELAKIAPPKKKRLSKKAPWGYKKDGTPKARPGRKV